MIIEPLARTASVREVTIDLMRQLGMTTIFGNPGSTELRFLKDWPEDFTYVMGLHEGCSVAMADAFAQITGNAAFVSLHSAGGLGNAMGTIYTAYRNQAPLVIMAGQQTRAMLMMDPFLFAQDAAEFPRPYVKWSIEPPRAEDVPVAIARAYYVAMQRPFGPTFVSIPEDDWDRSVNALGVRRIYANFVADDAALDALIAAFDASHSPALVVGSGVDRDGAADAVVALAERTGARVFASALASRCNFPEAHPSFAGALPRIRSGVVERLRGHDLVVVLGAPVFNYHIHAEGPFIEPETTVFQLTDDANAASWATVGTSIITSLRPALERILPRLRPAARPAMSKPHQVERIAPGNVITIEYLLQSIAETLPSDALIAEEAPSTHTVLHDYLPMRPGAYFSAASGSLGYGLPAAVGCALAAPDRRIVAIIGDGSSYYSIQGIWTAVEHRLPITFIIVNNGGYGAMKAFAQQYGSKRSPSFDIEHVDFVALGKGFGAPGMRVERAADLVATLREAHRSTGPVLVDVIVESTVKELY
ncbi:MAG TPA: benzoylformate decarboxylase [Candidatus Binatia bacterium]|nr:benzoylformate decarboxylase [Candidatus Binatia bacterium]